MAIVSHIPETSKAAMQGVHLRRPFLLLALLIALILLVLPRIAWGDIYKWTDEKGRTFLSNVPPTGSGKVKNVEVLAKDSRFEAKEPAHVATPTEQALIARVEALKRQLQSPPGVGQASRTSASAATPAEQALLARVEGLERQLEARQYAAQPTAMPAPTSYYPATYYPPTPPPPPPSPSYYSSGYASTYYPSYYPTYYYPVVPSYSYVYPAATYIARPAFLAPHGGPFHVGGGHRGRR